MSDIDLPQEEADNLISMPKQRANDEISYFPSGGSSLNIPLISEDHQESFLLDIYRGRIDLSKIKFQNRSKQIVVLLRLDLNGSPHRNPDNEEITCLIFTSIKKDMELNGLIPFLAISRTSLIRGRLFKNSWITAI
jgi:hypothetical protein